MDMAVGKLKGDFTNVLHEWDEKADEIADGFLRLFHRDAPLVTHLYIYIYIYACIV